MSFAARVSRLKRSSRTDALWLVITLVCAGILSASAQGPDHSLDARSMGKKTAPVTVYEMADFQCPVCRDFALQDFPVIQKEYIATGKVRWVFINYPLSSIHANAVAAAEFAVCASKQGKFWPTHDMLYSTHDDWENLKNPAPFFESKMAGLGINRATMATCLQSASTEAIVRDDAAGAERSGAHSTPSFYIEGGMIEGLYPLKVYQRVLDSIYAVKSQPRIKG